MHAPAPALQSFAYRAQTRDGQSISGTIDGADVQQAREKLEAMHLRLVELEPGSKPIRPKRLGADEFIAFNQQLAHLTAAGLPVEHALRLIGQDIRTGRLGGVIRQIADELEKGTPLSEALGRYRGQFPAVYGRLVEAGVRAGNLPGMLFNLASHLELLRRLKGALWRSLAYPLMVFMGITVVTVFLGWFVAPQFHAMFASFKTPVPRITALMILLSKILPGLMLFVLAAIACGPALLAIARLRGAEGAVSDALVLPLPLVGQIVRANLVAGWCNAVRLGIEAGMDLPASIALAGDACISPRLRADGRAMIEAIEAGKTFESVEEGKVLPATVRCAMSLGMQNNDLAATLRSLSDMYEQQAENRLAMLPTILTPLIVLLLACAIGLIMLAVLLPVLALFRSVIGI